jgi:hypothetical protein
MISKYPRVSILDLFEILLYLQLAHLLLELLFVPFSSLLRQGAFPPLLRPLQVDPIHILFLRLHYALLSLFLFGFVISAFFEFFEFLPELLQPAATADLLVFDDVKAGICVVEVTRLPEGRDVGGYGDQRFRVGQLREVVRVKGRGL